MEVFFDNFNVLVPKTAPEMKQSTATFRKIRD